MISSAHSFAGQVLITRLTAGGQIDTSMPILVSQCSRFLIGETATIQSLSSLAGDDRGQIRTSVARKGPTAISLTLAAVGIPELAILLCGLTEAVDESLGELQSETIALVPGEWVALSTGQPIAADSLALVESVGGDPIAESDLQTNLRIGLIRYLGSAPVSATATYRQAARSGWRIRGSAAGAAIRAKIRLDGINLSDGSACIIDVSDAMLAPSGEIDFASAAPLSLDLSGEMRTPRGQPGPYTIDLIDIE